MKIKSRACVGVFLLIVGIVIIALAQWRTNALNAVPLSVPIKLSQGSFPPQSFKPRVTTQHVISIVFDSSNMRFEELDCSIGMREPNSCLDAPDLLDVKWEVISNNAVIASSLSSGFKGAGYSTHQVERYVGRFEAERGRDYILRVQVVKDASRLSVTNPLLRVGPNLNGYLGTFIGLGLASFLGILLGIVGLYLVASGVFRQKAVVSDSMAELS